jgi:serine/threonine protein kinase
MGAPTGRGRRAAPAIVGRLGGQAQKCGHALPGPLRLTTLSIKTRGATPLNSFSTMDYHPQHAFKLGHRIGGYEIVRVVGQGGFRVAIKQFYPAALATRRDGTIILRDDRERDLFAKVLKRFEEEAKLQFNLNHPNVLKVRDYIAEENTGYMISDYVDGDSLRNFLRYFLSEQMFRETLEPIVRAVGYVHGMGTLHRDISPDNIMIDRTGKAILVDFGAAKFDLRTSRAYTGIAMFREEYAPPEQHAPYLRARWHDVLPPGGRTACAGDNAARLLRRSVCADRTRLQDQVFAETVRGNRLCVEIAAA